MVLTVTELWYHQWQADGAPSPPVEVVDLWHVSKQNLLFVLQRSRHEVNHGWIIHLRGISLQTHTQKNHE